MSKWLFECEPQVRPQSLAGLGHAHRALHRPEVRIGERDVDRLQLERVRELAPVRGDHVRGGGQPRGAAELRHHLAAREPVFGAAGILGVGHHARQVPAQADRVREAPAAVRVERDPRAGKALVQRADGLHFLLAAQHAALQLEVVEAVELVRAASASRTTAAASIAFSFRSRNQSSAASGSLRYGKVRAAAVAHVEEVAQHLDAIALPALAQQVRDGHAEELAQEVEHRGLHRRHGVDRRCAGRRSAVPRPPASRSANRRRISCSTRL